MKGFFTKLAPLCIAVMGLIHLLAGIPLAVEGIIEEIKIEGNVRVESATIKTYLKSKVGESIELPKISDDIKSIMAQGFFNDVVVETEPGASGPILIFRVKEKPTVKNVKYSGNDKVHDDDIDEILTLKRFEVLDMDKVNADKEQIYKLYQVKGYYLAEVFADIEEEKQNQVSVTYRIDEHARVMVERIEILGNEKYSDKELKKVMGIREESPISFFNKKGTFDDEIFNTDIQRLLLFYWDRGYLRVKIDKPQVFITPDRTSIYISYHLVEGSQFRVGKIEIKGDLIRTEQDLKKTMRLKEGHIFGVTIMRNDIENIANIYADEGYAYANVIPDTVIHDEEKLADLIIDIDKGLKVFVERIDITGNFKTRDKVIRRQLKITEGEYYSLSAIRKSEVNIKRLGFFKEVKILTMPGSETDRIRLDVKVEETATGSLSAGAGFSSTEQFMFTAQISQNNLLGRGQSLTLSLLFGGRSKNFSIRIFDPYCRDTRWSCGGSLFIRETQFTDFTKLTQGLTARIGRLLPRADFARLFVQYSYDETRITGFLGSNELLERLSLSSITSSYTVGINRNKTNNLLDPTSGTDMGSSVEFAGRTFGGQNVFRKYAAKYSYYKMPFLKLFEPEFPSILRESNISLKGRIGLLDHDQGDKILITERYFLGGINNLRGYEARSISPTLPPDDPFESELHIGGNKMLLFNAEYIFPIAKRIGVKFVVFFDAGNTYNDNEEYAANNLRYDWGVGIRWFSPFGPLRFELGFPIDPEPGEDKSVFNFAIGNPVR